MNETITVRLPKDERTKIEKIIKQEYPNLKTISDVVRLALANFIETNSLDKRNWTPIKENKSKDKHKNA